MLKLSQAIGGWRPRAGAWAADDPVVLLGAVWGELVGDAVARHSHPLRQTGDALLVVTQSSSWSQQLSLLAERILAAIRARVPNAGIERLRFRVGTLPARRRAVAPAAARVRVRASASGDRPDSLTAAAALERFKASVVGRQRAKRAAGWNECAGCGALIPPGGAGLCIACTNARTQERNGAAARLLFEAPWLGYKGTAALVDGLSPKDYGSIRRRLLASWWAALELARKAKRLSRDGRERLIASSYVVLKSELPPEEIRPATVRNVLGDELHELLYETEPLSKTHVE